MWSAAAAPLVAAALLAAGCGDAEDRSAGPAAARTAAPVARTAAATTPSPPAAPRLTLRQAIGQRFVFAYSGLKPPRALERRIARGEAAGVILFGRNIRSVAQVRATVERLQRIKRVAVADAPLLVMVDQEGGAVRRLPGAPVRGAGDTPSADAAYALGASAAKNLKRAGVNVDLAPVLDVARPGSAMEAEGRSYGRDPEVVGARANRFASALRADGVAPVYKHFPGFGAATVNTDDAAARIDLSLDALRAVDLKPYARAFPDAVMVSTAIYPRVDPRPAAFSRRWVTDELRGRLKYGNVVTMTDDLQAPAVAKYGSPAQLAYFAMRAGVDLPIFAKDYTTGARAAAGLEQAVRSGRLSRAALDAGAARVRDWRASFVVGDEQAG